MSLPTCMEACSQLDPLRYDGWPSDEGTRPEAGHEDDTPTLQRWNGTAGGPKGTLPSRKAEAVIRIGHGFVPLLLGGGDGAVQTSDADLV